MHTVARIWKFLRDGYFVDARTEQLQLRAAIVNYRTEIAAFWQLHISMLPAGRLRGRGSIETAPLHIGRGEGNNRAAFRALLKLTVCGLAVLHSLLVVGVLPTLGENSWSLLSDEHASSTTRYSVWFRWCCMVGCIGLTASLVLTFLMGSAARRLLQRFEVSTENTPTDEYLPVTMYQNLWSSARMLLPAKTVAASGGGDGVCKLVSDGSSSDLQVDPTSALSSTPLWVRPTDTRSFDRLSLMLVRLCCRWFSCFCIVSVP